MKLQINNISKTFGSFKALEEVSFDVAEGSVFGLLGPNGAGKTTLIRIVNRIIQPDGGQVLFNGSPITDKDVRSIGYMPEERGLYKKMRVADQVIYLAQLKGLSRSEATKRLRHWFDKFDISDWWNRPVEQLSKGMQQKVQFIVTVIHEPQLLIFDEPFSGFDPVNATLLKNEILELRRKGATIIISTHNMASVEELCDDIALIDKSHVVLSGNVSQIRMSHSNNLFEVVVTPKEPSKELDAFSVDVTKTKTLRITLPPDKSPNDLLDDLMSQYSILSFREILPSMNDIFVQSVTRDS